MKITRHAPEPVPVEQDTFTIEGLTQREMDYLVAATYHCGSKPDIELSSDIHSDLLAGGGHAARFNVVGGKTLPDRVYLTDER